MKKLYWNRLPLEKACKKKELVVYKHKGFWQCMDTKRLNNFKKFNKKSYE